MITDFPANYVRPRSTMGGAPTLRRGLLTFALVAVAYTGLMYFSVPLLPDEIAIHFNARGQADDWAEIGAYLIPLNLGAGILSLVTFLTVLFLRRGFAAALLLASVAPAIFGWVHLAIFWSNYRDPPKLSLAAIIVFPLGFVVIALAAAREVQRVFSYAPIVFPEAPSSSVN